MKIYDERTFKTYTEETKTVRQYCDANEKDERNYYVIDMEYFSTRCLYKEAAPTFKPIEWDGRQENSEIAIVWMDNKKVVMVI